MVFLIPFLLYLDEVDRYMAKRYPDMYALAKTLQVISSEEVKIIVI